MSEEQIQPQETEQSLEQTKWYTPLIKETPLSRYFAMTLFVTLPFVGFWLGMEYGNHKEQSFVPTAGQDEQSDSDNALENYYVDLREATKHTFSNRDNQTELGFYKAITSDDVLFSINGPNDGNGIDFATGEKFTNAPLREAIEATERKINEETPERQDHTITKWLYPALCNQDVSWHEDGVLFFNEVTNVSHDIPMGGGGQYSTFGYVFSTENGSLVRDIGSDFDDKIKNVRLQKELSSGEVEVFFCAKDYVLFNQFDFNSGEHVVLKYQLDTGILEIINDSEIENLPLRGDALTKLNDRLSFKNEISGLINHDKELVNVEDLKLKAADERFFVFTAYVRDSSNPAVLSKPVLKIYDRSSKEWYSRDDVNVNYEYIVLWRGNILLPDSCSYERCKSIDASLQLYIDTENFTNFNLYGIRNEVRVSNNALFFMHDDGWFTTNVYMAPSAS